MFKEDTERKMQQHATTMAELAVYDLASDTDTFMILDSSRVVEGKPSFYEIGPPAIAWGRLPDNEHISIPVLITTQMTTNDPLYNPGNWRIKLNDIHTQEHEDGKTPMVRGELVRFFPQEQRTKKLPPTNYTALEKGVVSDANVVEISSPNGSIRARFGDSGSMDIIGQDGKLIASYSANSIITDAQLKERRATGSRIRAMIFKEANQIATLLPKGFWPPFNWPLETGTLDMIKYGIRIGNAAADLAEVNATIVTRNT